MQITWPASTASPSATFTSRTVPCIGLDDRVRLPRRRAGGRALPPAARELAVRRLGHAHLHLDPAAVDLGEL